MKYCRDFLPVSEAVPPTSTKIPFPEHGMPPRTERIRIVFEDETRSTQAFPDANGKNWYLKTDGTIVFVEDGDEIPWNSIPLQRAETRTPAPAPRTRKRIVFEECDEPEVDVAGNFWYSYPNGLVIGHAEPQEKTYGARPLLRRDDELVPVEPTKPERWNGYATACNYGSDSTWYASVGVSDTTFSVDGIEHDTCEEANADIPSLKALAETYAAQHGAVIEWEDAK